MGSGTTPPNLLVEIPLVGVRSRVTREYASRASRDQALQALSLVEGMNLGDEERAPLTDPVTDTTAGSAPDGGQARSSATHMTRGFLFADLRGYANFVETHGDDAGARLLASYRRLVRSIVPRFDGAEIKTEGDSFYVVFPSASGAVTCGLAIAAGAAAMGAQDPGLPIRVGIGVHAGETAETSDGYVGSAINLAARVCALADAGEVLVTDTVRSLTRTSSELQYVSRGRKRLKGIPEPVTLYAARNAVSIEWRGGSDHLQGTRRSFIAGPAKVILVTAALASFAAVLGVWILSRGGPSGAAAPPLPTRTIGASSGTAGSSPPSATEATSTPSPLASHPAPLLTPDQLNKNCPIADGCAYPVSAGAYIAELGDPRPEFELDSGWTALPRRGQLVLSLTDRPQSRLVFMLIPALSADACGLTAGESGPNQSSFLSWLRSQPALSVGTNVFRRFPHVSAVGVDVAVNAETACQYTDPPSVIIGPPAGGGLASSLQIDAGLTVRAYAFDLQSELVVVFVDAPNKDEFDLFLPRAEVVVASVRFDQE